MNAYIAVCVTLSVVYGLVKYVWKGKTQTSNRRPPCLPTVPVVGSLPFMRKLQTIHVFLADMAKKYGDVFAFYAGSKYVVVLNSHEAIREALVTRGKDFADRGEPYVEKNITNVEGRGIGSRKYGEQLRTNRSHSLTIMKKFGVGNDAVIEGNIAAEVERFIEYVRAKKGEAWYPKKFLQYFALNVSSSVLFGARHDYDNRESDYLTPYINRLLDSAEPIVLIFPIFAHFPPYRNRLARIRSEVKVQEDNLEKTIMECLKGTDNENNFVREYVNNLNPGGCDFKELRFIVRDLVAAGMAAIAAHLNWALVLIGNRPKILERIQKDIDAAVPRDRLPCMADKPNLSYLEATILEILRFSMGGPLGVPRSAACDTEVRGYNIPKGSMVITNLYAAHMNPEIWKDPEIFCPERFLDKNGGIINKELMISFSMGKRSCVGEILARQELFLFVAALLQKFNILPPEGETRIREELDPGFVQEAAEYSLRCLDRC